MTLQRSMVVVAAALGLVAVVSWHVPAQPRAEVGVAQPAPAAVKWEYGTLHTFGGGPGGTRGAIWTTADDEIRGRDWKELAEQLKAPFKEKGSAQSTIQAAVLNHLGSQGWELVSHSMTSPSERASSSVHVWTFKRRVP